MNVHGLKEGAVQFRSAQVEDLDATKGEMLVRAAPYGMKVDLTPNVSEVFQPKAFARAVKAPHRLAATWEHGGPLIGRGISAEDKPDGIWVRAKIGRTTAAKDVLSLFEDKLLRDISVEFRPIVDGMDIVRNGDHYAVSHRRAHLTGFAVTTEGAYGEGAFIDSVRDLRGEKEREELRLWLIDAKQRAQ